MEEEEASSTIIGVEPGSFKLLEICSGSASEGGWSYMIVCEIYLPRSRYGDKQVDAKI